MQAQFKHILSFDSWIYLINVMILDINRQTGKIVSFFSFQKWVGAKGGGI